MSKIAEQGGYVSPPFFISYFEAAKALALMRLFILYSYSANAAGSLAQLAEQTPLKRKVLGSIPRRSTSYYLPISEDTVPPSLRAGCSLSSPNHIGDSESFLNRKIVLIGFKFLKVAIHLNKLIALLFR